MRVAHRAQALTLSAAWMQPFRSSSVSRKPGQFFSAVPACARAALSIRHFLQHRIRGHHRPRRSSPLARAGQNPQAAPDRLRRSNCLTGHLDALVSLKNVAERLRRLSGLLIADVGIAHRGADVLCRSSSWISRKSFPTWLRRIVVRCGAARGL